MPGQHSQLTPILLGRWVEEICVFTCNLPPALLAERSGSFTCHCGNLGVEGPPRECQQTKLTLENKILPLLLPGFELATFGSRVRRAYQQATPAGSYPYGRADHLVIIHVSEHTLLFMIIWPARPLGYI